MRNSGIIFLLLIVMCCNPPAPTEVVSEPTFKIAEDHAKVWTEAIAQVMELADAMPEESYGFKPHDSIRTFAEQLVHIGSSSKVIAHIYLKDAPPPTDQQTRAANSMSKAEIKATVSTQLEEVRDLMVSMSDESLREEITSFSGKKMSRLEGMLMVHDHLTNHKAKANLYIRLSGANPPEYRYY